MLTSNILILAFAFLLQLAPPGGASPQAPAAQGTTIETGISETGLRRIPIAIPSLDAAGASAPAGAEITEALRSDLEASGYFLLVPPDHYRLVAPEPAGTIPYQGWQSIGAEALVLGNVTPEGDRFLIEARLFETQGHRQILGRRYRGDGETARLIAHRLADEIILHFTGERGISQSKIAFVAQEGSAKEIFLMDYDGARARRLTRNGSLNLSPTWSPDGERIALTSFKDGQPSVYILDREGGSRRISLPESPLNIAPDWSPDGKQIAYSASLGGNTDLYTLRLQSGGAQRLTFGPFNSEAPTWSPDGRQIAFASDRTGAYEIYRISAAGGEAVRLTRTRGAFAPAWSR